MAAKTKKRGGQSFLQGALILTASMAVVKIIGALFKIPLGWILGPEGFGYFNSAYDLYNPLFTIATAGFPIAIARMVSENMARKRYRDVRQIHRVSIPIFLTLGLIGFLLMVVGTFIYCNVINTPDVKYATLTLAPTILFACLMSIYRGYYEGMQNMFPTAISEVIEALCKLILGLTASQLILYYGMNEYAQSGTVFGTPYASEALARSAVLPFAAAGAIVGITIGSAFGFIYLFIRFKLRGDGITKEELICSPRARSGRSTIKLLISIAVPIAIGALVMNVASLVDSTLIQRRLYDIMQNNPEELTAIYKDLIAQELVENDKVHTTLYGCYGYAATLMMLIPAITQTFGISALPSVTRAWTEGSPKKIKASIESVIRITMLVTIPAGLGLSVMAKPIMSLLYSDGGNTATVDTAASVLVILGIAAIFTSTSTPLCSMLQAVGRVDLPVKLLSVGVIIKIILNYTLVGIPAINIQGAGVGTLVCYVFITFFALYFLCKEAHVRPDMVSIFLKPLAAAVICAGSAYGSYYLLTKVLSSAKLCTLLALVVAVIIYVIALLVLKAFTKTDLLMLPKGKKIAKALEKRHWIG